MKKIVSVILAILFVGALSACKKEDPTLTQTRADWQLQAPAYMGGVLSANAYDTGPGMDCNLDNSAGKMQIITGTTRAEFDAYLHKVEGNDYQLIAREDIANSTFIQYAKDGKTLYTYYVGETNQAHVITDSASVTETQFEYTYTPSATDTTSFYQYALMNDPYGVNYNTKFDSGKSYPDCGMFYVIKTADNRLILIDGGDNSQATDAATAGLVDFLYEITNQQRTEKLRIACAIVSHAHSDHYKFIDKLVSDYTQNIQLERVAFNFPSWSSRGVNNATYEAFGNNLQTKFPSAQFMKVHTGQKITLGNVTMEIITTHEDLVSPVSGYTQIGNFNYTSTMFKFSANGKGFLAMADWGGSDVSTEYNAAAKRVFDLYRTADEIYPHLKADIIQAGHHGLNDLQSMYDVIGAKYAFVPQADSDFANQTNNSKASKFTKTINDLKGAGATHIFFQSRYTYGLTIKQNGDISHSSETMRGADDGYFEFLQKHNYGAYQN